MNVTECNKSFIRNERIFLTFVATVLILYILGTPVAGGPLSNFPYLGSNGLRVISATEDNPYSSLYRDDDTLWTSLAPGAKITARVGVPSASAEKYWLKARPMYYNITIGPHGHRGHPPGVSIKRSTPLINPHENRQTLRILVIGDSTPFGYFVDDRFTLPVLLETLADMANSTRPVEALNYGVPGYSSLQTLRDLKKNIHTLKPDLIVCCTGVNDARDTATRYPASLSALDDKHLFIVTDSLLAENPAGTNIRQWIETKFSNGADNEAPLHKPSGIKRIKPEEYAVNIEKIIRLSRSEGSRIIFLSNALSPDYSRMLRRVVRGNEAGIIDCDKLFVQKSGLMLEKKLFPETAGAIERFFGNKTISSQKWLECRIDPCHPSPVGHFLIAWEILHRTTGLSEKEFDAIASRFDTTFSALFQ